MNVSWIVAADSETYTGGRALMKEIGGLLKEVRHYAHKYMHEVLVDLLYMQKELHPAVFTVMEARPLRSSAAWRAGVMPEVCDVCMPVGGARRRQ